MSAIRVSHGLIVLANNDGTITSAWTLLWEVTDAPIPSQQCGVCGIDCDDVYHKRVSIVVNGARVCLSVCTAAMAGSSASTSHADGSITSSPTG